MKTSLRVLLPCLAALLGSISFVNAADLRQGLVAYWQMEGSDGVSTPDTTPIGNHLRVVGLGASNFVTGRFGNAVSLNGASTYMTNLHSPDASVTGLPIYSTNGYTVMMWVKGLPQTDKYLYAEGNTNTAGSTAGQLPLFILQTGQAVANNAKLDVIIRNNTGGNMVNHLVSTAVVFDNNWHHIAWVDDGGDAKLYVDGNLDPTNFNYTPFGSFTLNTSTIGSLVRAAVSTGNVFNGLIDDVALWQRALTADEAQQVRTNSLRLSSAPGATPTHLYHLNGSYVDQFGGPPLIPNGGTLVSTGYSFLAGQGLSLSNAISSTDYSIELVFSITDTNSYRKLVDFKNRTGDEGLYNLGGRLNFYPEAAGTNTVFRPNQSVHAVLTRDSQTGEVTAYINGVRQFTFIDSSQYAVFSAANNVIHFFRDDAATGDTENTRGFVDRIQLFDGAVSALDVLVLYETLFQSPPVITLTSPTNNTALLAPASVNVNANATDSDGTVTNVAFHLVDFDDTDVLLGNDTIAPYQAIWNSPTQGWYNLYAIATDNRGASTTSAGHFVTVYDANGTPRAQFFNPTNGAVFEGPIDLPIFLGTTSPNGVTNVEFSANGSFIGRVPFAPPISPVGVNFTWTNAPFGTGELSAVSFDASGLRGTSAPVTVIITVPPTNTVPPTIASQNPAANAVITNLTSIQLTFSERVTGVNAADLLINGTPATQVSGSGSNYTFTVTRPAYGVVAITWAPGHGITDIGYPSSLPFDGTAPGETWNYDLVDLTPPTVIARTPVAGTTVNSLSQVTVTFSEPVTGVNAADLLVNGTPAISLGGFGSNYVFNISQPASGAVNFTWVGGHGITDLASPPNSFNGAAANWSVTLDARTILVQSNSTWLFIKGQAEASSPISLWRTNTSAFNDAGWSNAPAPFSFGEPTLTNASIIGTALTDMANNAYNSIYLRKRFSLNNASSITNLFLVFQSDDGFIAWINGFEVARYNMPGGNVPYNGSASQAITEPNNRGAAYIISNLVNTSRYLVNGTNVLAVHAFNVFSTQFPSSDFSFNAQLFTFALDPSLVGPRVASVTPPAGNVPFLTNITVTFSEPVSGVGPGDLRINGVPATTLIEGEGGSNSVYSFRFDQPAYGPVSVTWAAGHGIQDFDSPPKPFDGAAAGSTFQYSLLNPSAPTVASQIPLAGSTVTNLTQITVNFSEPVTGVDAGDFRVNGASATSVSGGPATYLFAFAQPAYGNVSIAWTTNNGIRDLEDPATDFDLSRPSSSWSYTLVDQIPPVVITRNPPADALVTNLTQLSVVFSKPVIGVNAGDLLVNGTPAATVSGFGAGPYAFTFAQPNASIINITWANAHGITDQAAMPNAFNSTGSGATWSYTTPDNLPPTVVDTFPQPLITVRSLTQVRVTFNEPVTGVDTNDLLLNGVRARQLTGSGAGPYTFTYLPPSNGLVQVRWSTNNGITDRALPTPNSFAGGEWSYILDSTTAFAGKVLINEIMFDPPGGARTNEWIELRNDSTNLINLTGWRFTRGVDFSFPNVAMPAGSYLVVAADVAAFQARYPGVTNVVGGWTGSLANSGEILEIETALGETVNSVRYASEGDWAQRERGNGADPVASTTRSGSTATVSIFSHGLNGVDEVVFSGANQPEYNGRFTITRTSPSTFTIPVAGAPATPATGNIICHWVLDDNVGGWSWFSAADGFSHSMELASTGLPNTSGQNWLASANAGGTPGRVNSTATNNAAPLLLDVTHFPPVPRSTDSVAITARIRDEASNGVANATLFYRLHTDTAPGAFLSTNLLDNGLNGDGLANDGLYGAVLPPHSNGTVVEFYVQAGDIDGRTRTWPAPSFETNGPGATFGPPGQYANALYQVNNESITNTMPLVRLVLSGSESAVFPPANRNSDGAMNCTLITTDGGETRIRYLCDVRIRGAGSRSRTPPNNRVNIPGDNPWNDLTAINLNSQYVHAQLLGNTVALKSGLPAEPARVVQYRINDVNPAPITAPGGGSSGAGWGTFLLVEAANGELTENLFPQDGDGNLYRASIFPHNADLNYQGTNPNSYLNRGYFKNSNRSENNWTDLMQLTFAFSQVGPNADYVRAISTNVNVEKWMTYFAVGTLVNYGETALFNGRGDDYALYRGETDRRFMVLGHDFDTVFGQGDTGQGYYPVNTNSSIFIMLNPPNPDGFPVTLQNVLQRFFTNAAFAPVFYSELKRLCDTTFHPSQFNPLADQLLGTWGGPAPDANTIAAVKRFANNRRSVALSQIPLALTISNSLPTQNGYLFTATPTVALSGSSHAIDTRKVLVNGAVANWSAFGATWTASPTLQPGLNRVLVQSLNSNDVEFARAIVEIWYDDGAVQNVSGALTTDTTWSPANGPYNVTGNLTVNSGVTLTILPGTTIYLGAGVNLTVANGGRLLAEGTDSGHIRFTRTPGTANNWGGLIVNGAVGSPETRIAYADFEFNGSTAIDVNAGTLFLSRCTFGNTTVRYLDLDGASFVIEDCYFPRATAQFEPLHGSQGIKSGGRGIFRRNFVGKPIGYNDSFDFTGGNRPGPILQIINNVFTGSDDDILDFDSTDAWVEGNIFLHVHRNGSPDSASAISGGSDNAENSHITAIGNLFYDVDHAANAKQTNFYTFYNNTIVRQTRVGGVDSDAGIITMADDGTSLGLGFYLEGNIISGAEKLVRTQGVAQVTFTNNVIHQLAGAPWSGPGGNNSTNDPQFVYLPQLSETTNFTSWAQAQVLWQWFSLRAGSPAAGTGPNGLDKGALVPYGASISGEPSGTTPVNTATLRVGLNRTGSGIPATGFPNGSGFTHYKWRLDGSPWSAETPIASPITLNSLANGPHYVEVSGRNDAGFYQDDAVFGSDAAVSRSRTWTVNTSASPLRLNEVLAQNTGASNHFGTTPDLIELWNMGSTSLNLGGVGLTDDPSNPAKFLFPPNTMLAAGTYLTVFANNADGTPGFHLGFGLGLEGESIYLYDSATNGGAIIDSITFGPQLPNLSIGRLGDGSWTLTQPTFGGPNRAASTGNPRNLRINEWLAIAQAPFNSDFIELYNLDPLPVALGGLYLSDELVGWPDRHQIAPLSFIAGNGYLRFLADGDAGASADHVDFGLSGEQGFIGLFLPNLTPIDCVTYQPQQPNISQGRSPNGSSTIAFFSTPTPGAPNPLITGPTPNGGLLVINEVLAANSSLAELDGRTPDWIELYNGTTNTVNLGDRSLTDNSIQPRKYVLPANTILAPGTWLRVLCQPNATNPDPLVATNFALSGMGGSVYLFDSLTNGGSLLSSITYGIQTPDLSIGRVPDGSTNWVLTSPTPDALNTAISSFGDPSTLRVNEWLANPPPGNDDWFEIYNPGLQPIALGGLYLSDNLNNRTKHRIAALSFIGSGTNGYVQFRADGNIGAGADHTSFSLSASLEAVAISSTNGTLLNGVMFTNQVEGVSEGRFPDGTATVVAFGGTVSPGAPNYRLLTNIVINEVLTHTDLPLEDAIELRNLTDSPIDVGGWWISDDNGTLQKYQIPSPTIIPSNGFTVIYETHFTNDVEAAIPFALSSGGDEVVLSATTGGVLNGFRTAVRFGAAFNGHSFGRYVTSDGREEFVALSERTFGADDPGNVEEFRTGTGSTNASPRVGPVVISEIMFHPPDDGTNDNTLHEYIELLNLSTTPVPLYDPAAPTNSWRLRDAVDFDFPTDITLPAGGRLLVVSFDPTNNPAALASFLTRYNLDGSQLILGPWIGKLANDNDDIELRSPDVPNTNDVPYVLVERVHYFDIAPWTTLADGTSLTLQRVSETSFGNDPTNWVATTPTPGSQGGVTDSDGDGMPNDWESAHNFDPFNPNDATLDSDGDGLTNLLEFQLGTDPRDAQSGLRFTSVAVSGTNVVLVFNAVSNLTFAVEYTDDLGSGVWHLLQDVTAAPTNRLFQLTVPIAGPARFFRLRTPSHSAPGGLRIESIQPQPGGQAALGFNLPPNQPCAVEFKSTFTAGAWTTITNYSAASTQRVIQLLIPTTGASGFYRLRSP